MNLLLHTGTAPPTFFQLGQSIVEFAILFRSDSKHDFVGRPFVIVGYVNVYFPVGRILLDSRTHEGQTHSRNLHKSQSHVSKLPPGLPTGNICRRTSVPLATSIVGAVMARLTDKVFLLDISVSLALLVLPSSDPSLKQEQQPPILPSLLSTSVVLAHLRSLSALRKILFPERAGASSGKRTAWCGSSARQDSGESASDRK
jgi:hypothetical protein